MACSLVYDEVGDDFHFYNQEHSERVKRLQPRICYQII